jgi:dTDP-4-amino-4,6-dideoxygalactose transaminase
MTPAVLGGPRAVTLDGTSANRWPVFTEEDEAAVLAVLRDGDLSTHPVTRELEKDYCAYFGVRHALAHCNGTAALLASFFAINLQPGDEVIVPSATWWASVVPMMWLGAIPVFAETEPQRLGLDPADVEQRITPRTRAIVVVHLLGMPSRMTEILDIARRHGLKVIEDASHAHGARWRGRLCGTLGDVGVFSLQGHKLAPAGEGGILLTNDDALMERATLLGDVVRIWELPTPARRFAATSFGIKTRMSPLNAAVGRVQLRHLDERNARRNGNLVYLSRELEKLGFDTFFPPAHVQRVYFEYLIRGDVARCGLSMDLLITALQAEGCEVQHPRYPLVHEQPLFTEGAFQAITRLPGNVDIPKYRPEALPLTAAGNGRLLRLPAFPNASRELLDQYVLAFRKVLGQARQIGRASEIDQAGA